MTEPLPKTRIATAPTCLAILPVVEEHDPEHLILSLSPSGRRASDDLYALHHRDVEVMVLTICGPMERIQTVFEQWASAYLLKRSPIDDPQEAVEIVRKGNRRISEVLPKKVKQTAPSGDRARPDLELPFTFWKRQVIHLTEEGYTSREVGAYLDISPQAVEEYWEQKQALGGESIVDLIEFAYRREVIPVPLVQPRFNNV